MDLISVCAGLLWLFPVPTLHSSPACLFLAEKISYQLSPFLSTLPPGPCQWPLSCTRRLWVSECPSSQAATTHSAFCIFLRFCLRRWGHFKKVDGKSRLMINLLWCKKLLKCIHSRSLENVHERYSIWKNYLPFNSIFHKCFEIPWYTVHMQRNTHKYLHTHPEIQFELRNLDITHLLKTHWHLLSPFCCLDEDILLITFCQDPASCDQSL